MNPGPRGPQAHLGPCQGRSSSGKCESSDTGLSLPCLLASPLLSQLPSASQDQGPSALSMLSPSCSHFNSPGSLPSKLWHLLILLCRKLDSFLYCLGPKELGCGGGGRVSEVMPSWSWAPSPKHLGMLTSSPPSPVSRDYLAEAPATSQHLLEHWSLESFSWTLSFSWTRRHAYMEIRQPGVVFTFLRSPFPLKTLKVEHCASSVRLGLNWHFVCLNVAAGLKGNFPLVGLQFQCGGLVNLPACGRSGVVVAFSLWFVSCFRLTPAAPGSSQATGQIRAGAASLHPIQGNVNSELHLRPVLRLTATPWSLTHWERPWIKLTSSWIPVRFITEEPRVSLCAFYSSWVWEPMRRTSPQNNDRLPTPGLQLISNSPLSTQPNQT